MRAPQTRDRAALSAPRCSAPARAPVAVANRGDTPAWRAVSITGVPKADLPAESKGYAVSRASTGRTARAADLSKVRQTDLFVVVIKGTRTDASQAAPDPGRRPAAGRLRDRDGDGVEGPARRRIIPGSRS